MTRTIAELGAGPEPRLARRARSARASGSTSSASPAPARPRRHSTRRRRAPSSRAAIPAVRRRTRPRSRPWAFRSPGRTTPAHVTEGPRPDRLAVTKALTAIAPDHPELRAAAARGIPAEPWQQVIADAAHGRALVAVAGTHGKSTTAGWLTWILAETGLDPSAFVGRAAPGGALGRASRRRLGWGAATSSSSRPTSTPATSTPIAPMSSL